MKSDAFRMIRMLAGISLLCGLLIVATNVNTLARIRHNQEILMRESVAQLLPGIEKQVVYRVDAAGGLTVLSGMEGEGRKLFAGYDGSGRFLGIAIEAGARGYADVISAMYAYSPEAHAITGFRVVEMRETPGLGDRVGSDPEFLRNFQKLDATHPIEVVKHGKKKNAWEIDAISGATISSRAVGRLLENSIRELAPIIDRNLARIEKGQ
jgi:electron transport complex protein RnfG